jgi:hypothetical protein
MQLKCESVKFMAMKGVAVGYERNFVQHSNTYYAGAGDQWEFGPRTGASAGAGVYVTEMGGAIVDAGVWAEGSLDAGPARLEAEGRISVVTNSAELALGVAARLPVGADGVSAPAIQGRGKF